MGLFKKKNVKGPLVQWSKILCHTLDTHRILENFKSAETLPFGTRKDRENGMKKGSCTPKSPKAIKSDKTIQPQTCATFHEKKRMTRRVEPWAQSAELLHWSTGIETSLPSWLLIMLRISDLFFLSIFSHFEWPYLQIFLFLSHHIVQKQIAFFLVSWVHRWKGNLLQDEL